VIFSKEIAKSSKLLKRSFFDGNRTVQIFHDFLMRSIMSN